MDPAISQITSADNFFEVSVEERQIQLERILRSSTLRSALTLQQLLQFLVLKAADGDLNSFKEYTIGVEAFGRRIDFDPKTDTIVRVQTHRLRQKLKEYYDREGSHDPILIEIPKGHYCPTFHRREQAESSSGKAIHELGAVEEGEAGMNSVASPPVLDESLAQESQQVRLRYLFSHPIALILLVLSSIAAGFYLGSLRSSASAKDIGFGGRVKDFKHSEDPVKRFWAVFLADDPSPIIAYPNAVFLLDDSNDLLRFRRGASDNRGARVDPDLARKFASNPTLVANAGQLYYEDGYTGTGELEGVAMLATVFAQMGIKPTIKTSRNITREDLQQHSVILLGSPFQNIAVAQLLAEEDFTFQNPDARLEQWRARIVNVRPVQGESASYGTERDPETDVLKKDYSLISIQPGVVPGYNIAVIGGLDTKGTEGATSFMTSRQGIESLTEVLLSKGLYIPRNAGNKAGGIASFQALVQVQLEKGDQVLNSELVAVHPTSPRKIPLEASQVPNGRKASRK